MGLIDAEFVEASLTKEAPFCESHGAQGSYLGIGLLYYSLVYARRTRVPFLLDNLADIRADDLHAGLDALGHFQPEPVDEHLVNVRAAAFPIVDLVHDLKVARIAERLPVAAVPDGSASHDGRHDDFGEGLRRFEHLAVSHDALREIVPGAP